MKRNSIIIQFLNNEVALLNKNKITIYPTKSIDKYKIINTKLFISDFLSIIEEQKINNHFLTDNISILIDTSYTIDDRNKLITIFKDFSFNDINFIYYNEILSKNDYELNVLINKEIINIYYKNKTYKLYYYNDKLYEVLDIFLKSFSTKYNIKIIKLFGNITLINKVIDKINIHGVYLYKYANSLQIPIILLK